MFGIFKSQSFTDVLLGELHRKAGNWRGTLDLSGIKTPLILPGTRSAPDQQALDMARSAVSSYEVWRGLIAEAMFEHYMPYADSFAADKPESLKDQRCIAQADDVWSYTSVAYLAIIKYNRELCIEIGYQVAWDEEHTLGARLQNGQLIELNGSVLPP